MGGVRREGGALDASRVGRVLAILAFAAALPAGFPARAPAPTRPGTPLALTASAAHLSARSEAAAAFMRGERLSVDRATPAALRLIPGLGSVRAGALRKAIQAGQVRVVADLPVVDGFGPVLSTRVAEHLRLETRGS